MAETYRPKSGHITFARYDENTELLTVGFRSGAMYEYQKVSLALWNSWRATFAQDPRSMSTGKFFNEHIKTLPNQRKIK